MCLPDAEKWETNFSLWIGIAFIASPVCHRVFRHQFRRVLRTLKPVKLVAEGPSVHQFSGWHRATRRIYRALAHWLNAACGMLLLMRGRLLVNYLAARIEAKSAQPHLSDARMWRVQK